MFEGPELQKRNPMEKELTMEEIEKILHYISRLGEDITKGATIAEAMLKEAEARGIPVNIDNQLKKFEATEEIEIQLINIRQRLIELRSSMFTQGVKMTAEDLEARLEKMNN